MKNTKDQKSRQALTALVLELFRLNSRLLISGDRLVAGLGLTSARWQILGAIAEADQPRPVAWLARDMGGARQNVQRIVNDLEKEGVVAFVPNPYHRKAHLVVMTERGREIYNAALQLWQPLVSGLAEGIGAEKFEDARALLVLLRERLEQASLDTDNTGR